MKVRFNLFVFKLICKGGLDTFFYVINLIKDYVTSIINRYILDYSFLYCVCNFTCCILLDDYLDYIQDYYGEVVHEELIRVSIYYI